MASDVVNQLVNQSVIIIRLIIRTTMSHAQMMTNFNVGYYDEYGNLIDSLRAARRHYVRRWDGLPLDVVSLLPLELLKWFYPENEAFHALILIHALRFIHVKRYLKNLQSKIDIK